MNRGFYLDTSALVKLYHQETGTEQVEEIFRQSDHRLVICELTVVEFYSALFRRLRMMEITESAHAEALRNFEVDCVRRYIVYPLDPSTIQKAKALLQTYGKSHALRTLDALQLSACLMAGASDALCFVCADVRLLPLCELTGLSFLNPETPV